MNIFDLSRFTSPGVRLVQGAIDPSDFLNPANPADQYADPFNEVYAQGGGADQYLTPLDLQQMDVLGFNAYHGRVTPTVNVRSVTVARIRRSRSPRSSPA